METKLNEIISLPWVHSIDLGNGVITPGQWGSPSPLIRHVFNQLDFKGKRVLDIGCWDGLWSFEAERRGAGEVYATDDISQRSLGDIRTFNAAKEQLKSKVQYFPETPIERLSELPVAEFDIVLFLGVAYHLRDPLRALALIRNLMKDGGLIVVESAAIYDLRKTYADFYYKRSHHNDFSNWWVPTVKCLEEWVDSSFFRRRTTYCYDKRLKSKMIYFGKRSLKRLFRERSVGRAVVVAEAFRGKDPYWKFPDPMFDEFDENIYS